MTSRFDKLVVAFTNADDDLQDLLLQESNVRVAAQIDLMKAGDARAMGVVAAAVAIAAAGVAVAANAAGKADQATLFWSAAGLSISSSLALGLAVWALWPCKVEPQGWDPDTFESDALGKRPFSDIRTEAVALLQRRLDKNRLASLVVSSRAELALLALALSPVAAAFFAICGAGLIGWGFMGLIALITIGAWFAGQRLTKIRALRTRLEL